MKTKLKVLSREDKKRLAKKILAKAWRNLLNTNFLRYDQEAKAEIQHFQLFADSSWEDMSDDTFKHIVRGCTYCYLSGWLCVTVNTIYGDVRLADFEESGMTFPDGSCIAEFVNYDEVRNFAAKIPDFADVKMCFESL